MAEQIDLATHRDPDTLVTSGDFQMTVRPDVRGRLAASCQVYDASGWRDTSAIASPIVQGLDLRVEDADEEVGVVSSLGTVHFGQAEGSTNVGSWKSRVEAIPNGWIGIEVEVDVQRALRATPELLLWLGDNDTMNERQSHTFRQTLLSSPTVNCQGLGGNDLPVVYFFDPRLRVETIVYVPATLLTWTKRRFLDYRCSLKVDHEGRRYGVGLVHRGTESSLAEGIHKFAWFVRQSTLPSAPGEWEAQCRMITATEQFIPRIQAPVPSWGSVAAGALRNLLDDPVAQIAVDGYIGHPAYVRDTSLVRMEDRRPSRLELMTQCDVIPPLALYLRLHPDPRAEKHLSKLIATLPLFHLPAEHWVGNWFPATTHRPIEDIWYFLENALIKLPWIAAITDDDRLWSIFLDALSGAEEMARKVQYVFPLFVDIVTREPAGSSTNYSVGGLYAYGQMLGYARTGSVHHLEEARITLTTMCRLTVDHMWHEPQQLGFAAAAAALLAKESGDSESMARAGDLLAAQLRMVYWDDHSPDGAPLTGMFQACASLLYPAFKENVESILPWPHLLRAGVGSPVLLLRLLDAQRRHNSAFFEALRGDATGPAAWIPYENLGTVELPEEGRLGKEIYGAGEAFWLYLLLEGLGKSDDSEILLCSLDIPELDALVNFPPPTRSFVAFNPTNIVRSTTLQIPSLQEGEYSVCWAGGHEYLARSMNGQLEVNISLGAGETQTLHVGPTRE